ncbi:uncharacterized protein LOC125774986 [Anopheles funestus]|uniref:uncharacterized protein LOC125774986 n=1 Tax=Anopheles funestus TaxID=62324 RepID=UPI0020C706FE|nr:uncharacterized protein LOC125774986 [Anopheles funestus]
MSKMLTTVSGRLTVRCFEAGNANPERTAQPAAFQKCAVFTTVSGRLAVRCLEAEDASQLSGRLNLLPVTTHRLDLTEQAIQSHSGEAVPSTAGKELSHTTRTNWKAAQAIAEQYWKRWIKEYLPTISKREKWLKLSKPVQVDDIVTFPDENRIGKWIKGRVTETFAGQDGIVRSVRLKVGQNEYRKAVVNLAVLDVKPSDQNQDNSHQLGEGNEA